MCPSNGSTLVPRLEAGSQWLLLVVGVIPVPNRAGLSGRSSDHHLPPLTLHSSMDPVSLLLCEIFEEEGGRNKLCSLHLAAAAGGQSRLSLSPLPTCSLN